MPKTLFFDLEINPQNHSLLDIGWIWGEREFQGRSVQGLRRAWEEAEVVCGHNAELHDVPYVRENWGFGEKKVMDTLFLSVLLRPERKKHFLAKDYQLLTPWKSDPLADARLARGLLDELLERFYALPEEVQGIFKALLGEQEPFAAFFVLAGGAEKGRELAKAIREVFAGELCHFADLDFLVKDSPVELAYVLALLGEEEPVLPTPSWLLHTYPRVEEVFYRLRSHSCGREDCPYCSANLDPHRNLQRYFGYESFRHFEGDGEVALQEQAVRAALKDESFLAIFPTGGGKSLTFQLPALIRGEAKGALTVVISPLVALMKDQVDGLKEKSILRAETLNGLLSPLERAEAIERINDGSAQILYLAPESLRSNTTFRLLMGRMIDRFVIDEAHCFSEWGQDFRVDYLYIGDFIAKIQKEKSLDRPIPVSCFTATAKPKVMEDIRRYFAEKLGQDLDLYRTLQQRTNLNYHLVPVKEDSEKFEQVLRVLEEREGPAIIYVSRVRKTEDLSDSLKKAGVNAAFFHGKMHSEAKKVVQDGFKSGEIEVIVATSAFGMGVDKDDVSLVLHYEISNSLENYVQEAGRAGRDPEKQAKCVILFTENDLDKHFALLQGMKLSQVEINKVWRGIKSYNAEWVSRSALEIARAAGWDTEMRELETKVKTAINALEVSGYLKREHNSPRVFATGLLPDNLEKAANIVRTNRVLFSEEQFDNAMRILQYLYGKTETRVDYMADAIGLRTSEVSTLLNQFRHLGILSDEQDMSAAIDISQSPRNSLRTWEVVSHAEPALLDFLCSGEETRSLKVDLREARQALDDDGLEVSMPLIESLLRYWQWKKYLKRERMERGTHRYRLLFIKDPEVLRSDMERRLEWSNRIREALTDLARQPKAKGDPKEKLIEFSIASLKKQLEHGDLLQREASIREYEQFLLYLQTVRVIDLRGGYLVHYSRLNLQRKVMDNRKQYTAEDYRQLANFYEGKTEQIHIVGDYARRLQRNYQEALRFTRDYFQLPYEDFLKKYFPNKKGVIKRPLTEKKFKEIFGQLDTAQLEVVKDKDHKQILVAAGPGSGKTRVLVHKMASLLLMEDVKPEQFLMLAFNRPAVGEFRQRLRALVPGLGNHVDIFTYHGFAFHLVGKRGDLLQSDSIIEEATQALREENTPFEQVMAKSVIMLDEFQDVSDKEWDFLQAIMEQAGELRVIAAGDDDQSIYEFRGASLEFMRELVKGERSQTYFLTRNYRSKSNLVDFANAFLQHFPPMDRIKSDELLIAHQKERGSLRLRHYSEGHLIPPFVYAVANVDRQGTCAVLTQTNEEALRITALLQKKGVPALLLSSGDGFYLWNLVEFRDFTDRVKEAAKGELGFISRESWEEAKTHIEEEYPRSPDLQIALRAIEQFEREYKHKYKGEWLEFLQSLKFEDLYFPEENKVLVSTMHKSKGKEFDEVYMLIDGEPRHLENPNDEQRRVYYVAMTRAKNHLEIHTRGNLLASLEVPSADEKWQKGWDKGPEVLVLSCGLKDVNLGFFKSRFSRYIMRRLQTGWRLKFHENEGLFFLTNFYGDEVCEFSRKFCERLIRYEKEGYVVSEVRIAHRVWWLDQESGKEYLIVLPELELGYAPRRYW